MNMTADSTEFAGTQRLARVLLVMAEFDKPAAGDVASQYLAGGPDRNDRNHSFSRQLLHESVSQNGLHQRVR
jgi:hypothetical protein